MEEYKSPATLLLTHSAPQYRHQQIRRAMTAAGTPADVTVDRQLRAACEEMESLFINYLLQEMRATIQKSGFISGGRAEEIYTSLLDIELSKKISFGGGIGLSSLLLKQLSGQAEKNEGDDSK